MGDVDGCAEGCAGQLLGCGTVYCGGNAFATGDWPFIRVMGVVEGSIARPGTFKGPEELDEPTS